MNIQINNLNQTKKLAKRFAKNLKGGEIILLNGDLGAGKTTFTKFLAKALGVKEEVTSPTFTIMKDYMGKKYHIYHFDMYRMSGGQETVEFGLEEYIYQNSSDNIIIIEWSDNIKDILNGDFIEINIKKINENSREFSFVKD